MTIPRGFHHSVLSRASRQGALHNSLPFRGAIFSRVIQGDGDSERVKVDTVAGTKVSPFAYPFASRNAWIRGQPEPTTTMISVIGGDTLDVQPVGYFDPAKSDSAAVYRRVAAEARQYPTQDVEPLISPYRSLAPGELDIASQFAQVYLGKRDVLQARGGLSHMTLTSSEARIETALLSVKGHAHSLDSAGSLNDEIRYGTVRRAVSGVSDPTRPSLVKATDQVNSRGTGAPVFAKEFSVSLGWFGNPNKLLDHRQGVVVEDDGTAARSSQTQRALRARWQWFSRGGMTSAEIDDAGNALVELGREATEGLVVSVPSGDLRVKIGEQSGVSGGKTGIHASGDTTLSSDRRVAVVADGGFRLQTPKRGAVKADAGIDISAVGGTIKINTPSALGVKLGSGGEVAKEQYPVLVAHPQYVSTLNNYYSAQVSFSQAAGSYGSAAAQAWAAVGPLLMILDPSGVVMGLCQAAGAAAGVMSSQATPVSTAVTQHLPRLAQMPSGAISQKTVSE